MTEAQWAELPTIVSLGEHRRARIVRVDRWGILLDLALPFPGFMDRLHVGEDLDRYHVGDELEVVVVQFAEYNRQIRVRPLIEEQRQA